MTNVDKLRQAWELVIFWVNLLCAVGKFGYQHLHLLGYVGTAAFVFQKYSGNSDQVEYLPQAPTEAPLDTILRLT